MSLLDDHGFPPPQVLYLFVNGVADNARQGTGKQNAKEGDKKHKRHKRDIRGVVAADSAGVHQMGQADENALADSMPRQTHKNANKKHRNDRDHKQQFNQRRCSRRHLIVKPVGEFVLLRFLHTGKLLLSSPVAFVALIY